MTSSTPTSRTVQPPFDCASVDARLADYLDDEPPSALTAAERDAVDRHVAACARCRPLVRDLRAVTEAAAGLPALPPPRDLWADIAPRLAPRAPAIAPAADDTPARVLPFEVRHVRRGAPLPDERRAGAPVAWPRRWLAAAAVVLMAASAGTTYLLTRAGVTPNVTAPAQVADARPAAPAEGAPPATPAPAAAPVEDMPVGRPAGTPNTAPDAASSPRLLDAGAPARLVGRRAGADLDAVLPAAAAYDREIAALRAAVRERRGELDSVTVAVLVRNLVIIDAAIAQSRAALARDPHSPFLGDQLTRALGQKVELLRTVALLPRT